MFIDQIEEPKDKKDFSMRKNKTIKVGDLVQVAMSGDSSDRFGTITQINIAIDKNDIAGENGVRVNELDLELNYVGSISFKNDDSFPDEYWSYFYQIKDIYGHSEDDHELHKYEMRA